MERARICRHTHTCTRTQSQAACFTRVCVFFSHETLWLLCKKALWFLDFNGIMWTATRLNFVLSILHIFGFSLDGKTNKADSHLKTHRSISILNYGYWGSRSEAVEGACFLLPGTDCSFHLSAAWPITDRQTGRTLLSIGSSQSLNLSHPHLFLAASFLVERHEDG